jgi:hypothetical protein
LTANQELGAIVRAVLAVTNFILWAGRNKLGKVFNDLCLFMPRGGGEQVVIERRWKTIGVLN